MSKVKAVLMDPPWGFRTYQKKLVTPHRTKKDHYKVDTNDKIARALRRMGFDRDTDKDCALFMWVVDSHLNQAIELASWLGFEYKTIAFVWDKGRIGMGYWTRKEAEICLLFTRGKPKRLSAAVRQVIRAKRREHSRKPDEQYERIEALVAGPYAEYFSRTKRRGWRMFGNEVGKFKPIDN